jgi:hypothetical protein
METTEAREHLDLVDRVLAESNRRVCIAGEFFVVWGIVGAAFDLCFQLVLFSGFAASLLWVPAVLTVATIVFSVVRGRSLAARGVSLSLVQREYFNVMWIAFGLAAVVDCIAWRLFAGWGSAVIWSVAAAIVLLYIGVHQNRRAMIAGVISIVSIAVANFTPSVTGYLLAAGMLIGYAGFGVVEMLGRE